MFMNKIRSYRLLALALATQPLMHATDITSPERIKAIEIEVKADFEQQQKQVQIEKEERYHKIKRLAAECAAMSCICFCLSYTTYLSNVQHNEYIAGGDLFTQNYDGTLTKGHSEIKSFKASYQTAATSAVFLGLASLGLFKTALVDKMLLSLKDKYNHLIKKHKHDAKKQA